MRKAKAKSSKAQKPRAAKTAKNRTRYRKPAIRSEAFFRALRNTKAYAADPESLRQLFEEAAEEGGVDPERAV
jgi:predicted nucleotide-binding protein (sugar kinase/HSP70/actin superfamily)